MLVIMTADFKIDIHVNYLSVDQCEPLTNSQTIKLNNSLEEVSDLHSKLLFRRIASFLLLTDLI